MLAGEDRESVVVMGTKLGEGSADVTTGTFIDVVSMIGVASFGERRRASLDLGALWIGGGERVDARRLVEEVVGVEGSKTGN